MPVPVITPTGKRGSLKIQPNIFIDHKMLGVTRQGDKVAGRCE